MHIILYQSCRKELRIPDSVLSVDIRTLKLIFGITATSTEYTLFLGVINRNVNTQIALRIGADDTHN